jgi:hypothetical protein
MSANRHLTFINQQILLAAADALRSQDAHLLSQLGLNHNHWKVLLLIVLKGSFLPPKRINIFKKNSRNTKLILIALISVYFGAFFSYFKIVLYISYPLAVLAWVI